MAKAKKIATDADGLVVNEGPNPRFIAGRYVEVGDRYDPDALDSEAYAAKSTPVGVLTDEQLQAEFRRRNLPANPGAPANEPAAAPVAPQASRADLADLDEQRAEAGEGVKLVGDSVAVDAVNDKAEKAAADALAKANKRL